MALQKSHRVSRRQILVGGGGAVALGAIGAGMLARRPRENDPDRPPIVADTPEPVPSAAPTSPRPKGGKARLAAPAGFNLDTFDALATGEPTVAEVLGRTHSRLVTWGDFFEPRLEGDLAERWEQPDAMTWIFHLNLRARWHDRAPLDGRALVASDVVAHFKRMRALASGTRLPLGQRASEYAAIRSVSSPGPATVLLETEKPEPLLFDTLASRFALIQAPEAVSAFAKSWPMLRAAEVIGTGPFSFDGIRDDVMHFSAHRHGHREPLLDRLEVRQPGAPLDLFGKGDLDEIITRDRRDAASLRLAGGASELSRYEDSPVVSGFFVGSPPWNNPELLRAISGALNRLTLADRLFGGRAEPAGPVGPATPAFALTAQELSSHPGYRTDSALDALEARSRWTAAGGPALGPITIDIPSIFDPLYSASSTVVGTLNSVLGNQFRPSIETYTTISARTAAGRYGNGNAAFWFGWAPPLRSPDPTRELSETYDGRSPAAADLGWHAAELDARFDALGAEFNLARRAGLVREIGRAVLELGGSAVISWLLQRSEVFRREGLGGPLPTPFWAQHLDVDRYFDPAARRR